MDPIMQSQENKNELYELINRQIKAMDEQKVTEIMHNDAFSIERLEAASLEGKLNIEQKGKMNEYQRKQEGYNKKKAALEQGRSTPEGEIEYQNNLIQAEQNRMRLRLMKAAVLDRRGAAKQVKAEGLENIISYRIKILENCAFQPRLWRVHKNRLEREKAVYNKVMDELNLEVLTTAAFDKIKAERKEKEGQEEGVAELTQELLEADFSTKALESGYVIEHLDACLHKVELIGRAKKLASSVDSKAYAPIKQILETVEEYVNVVESALWEFGFRIDFDTLQMREIDANDEAFRRRRQAYQENGELKYYLGVKRYKQIRENGPVAFDVQQQESGMTRIEANLSTLEEKLKITTFKESGMRIMKSLVRSVGERRQVKAGDDIKATGAESQGKEEHLLVKTRLFKIYHALKEKLINKLKSGAKEFESLEQLVDNYVTANRKVGEKRSDAEQNEANALAALKQALSRVHKTVKNKSAKYAAILLGLLTEESGGYLEVPPGEIQIVEDGKIGLKKVTVNHIEEECIYKDCTNMPLFAHRPNIKDVAQGALGDCYLLAGLISVVNQNPEEIMNIMKDNGDGTVTVRFKREEEDASGNIVYTPCYTTVKKTVPIIKKYGVNAYSSGALWVKMIEKAYAASGLHIIDQINEENAQKGKPKKSFRQLRDDIRKGSRNVKYEEIEGGQAGKFVSLLLGKTREVHFLDKNRAEHVGERIGRMLPKKKEPKWKRSPRRKFGNESVDSIVYEYIEKQDSIQAQQFLTLEKPKVQDRTNAALMANYRTEKEKLQRYRRTCIMNLDIVDSIAREKKVDLLKMGSQREIEDWYREIKDKFLSCCIKKPTDPLDKEEEIIKRVLSHYVGDDFKTRFMPITVKQFNDTLDILQARQIELLKRNKKGSAGAGNAAQQSYYSARDLKLFGRIEDALRSGSYVGFGTRKLAANGTGINGESEAGGMLGTHAYSIINTRRVVVDNQERLYFVVMNPWARKGVVYRKERDGIREHAVDKEREEGVFYLDLQRFAEIVRRWDAVPA